MLNCILTKNTSYTKHYNLTFGISQKFVLYANQKSFYLLQPEELDLVLFELFFVWIIAFFAKCVLYPALFDIDGPAVNTTDDTKVEQTTVVEVRVRSHCPLTLIYMLSGFRWILDIVTRSTQFCILEVLCSKLPWYIATSKTKFK